MLPPDESAVNHAASRVGRVTIARVAQSAGVSKATVSLVLNGRAESVGISAATRESVAAIADRLGYTPNHAARSLRQRRTGVLALLVQDLANPFFTDIAVAARSSARELGYELNVVDAGSPEAEVTALERARGGGADAVIVASGRHAGRPAALTAIRDLARRGTAVVVLLDTSPDPLVPAIRIDVESAAHEATRYLIGLGHTRIAHLAHDRQEPPDAPQSAQGDRFRGYRRALAETGIPFDPRLLVSGPDSLEGGRGMIGDLLDRAGPRPTAALVYNDVVAIGALRGLRERGLGVPQDMALVSFDGIALGEFTTPALTTVDQPRAELGRLGLETAVRLLSSDGGLPPDQVERILPTRLVVRESCGG